MNSKVLNFQMLYHFWWLLKYAIEKKDNEKKSAIGPVTLNGNAAEGLFFFLLFNPTSYSS